MKRFKIIEETDGLGTTWYACELIFVVFIIPVWIKHHSESKEDAERILKIWSYPKTKKVHAYPVEHS